MIFGMKPEERQKAIVRIAKALISSCQHEQPSGNIYCSMCMKRQPYDGKPVHKEGCVVLLAQELLEVTP